MVKDATSDMSTDLSKRSIATTIWLTSLPWTSLLKMFLRSQKPSLMVLNQMTSSPPLLLILHLSLRRLSQKSLKMKQPRSWDTKDSVASHLWLTVSKPKLVTHAVTPIMTMCILKSHSANSPPSLAQTKSQKVLTLRLGLNPPLRSVSEYHTSSAKQATDNRLPKVLLSSMRSDWKLMHPMSRIIPLKRPSVRTRSAMHSLSGSDQKWTEGKQYVK